MGAEKLWENLEKESFIRALGALTGNQAVEMVQAGLKAIYLSGWQVAGDANDALTMYPDQSLYPVTSVPTVLRKINNALIRADQIQHMEGRDGEVNYFAPIVADAEAGFGGPLNTFELIKAMIEAEKYHGPSLIIAYAPCINHGLKLGMGQSQLEEKNAVEAGYWHLYRFNPTLKAEGKNPFVLDSKEPTASYKDFIMGEVRYSSLTRAFPERADALFEAAQKNAQERLETYKRLANG
jgi:hypothetical protein